MTEQHLLESGSSQQFLLARPASLHDTSNGMALASDTGFNPVPLAGVVIKLLDSAAAAVDADPSAAKYYIARATAALQSGRSDREGECRGRATKFARGGLSPWQTRLVTAHIDASLGSTIRTDDCAAIAKLSNSYFRRAFKESFGMTFSSYVSQRRVERAKEMMVMTDQPLTAIASRCGFADQSHFGRVFRRLVGPSPGDWRRQ